MTKTGGCAFTGWCDVKCYPATILSPAPTPNSRIWCTSYEMEFYCVICWTFWVAILSTRGMSARIRKDPWFVCLHKWRFLSWQLISFSCLTDELPIIAYCIQSCEFCSVTVSVQAKCTNVPWNMQHDLRTPGWRLVQRMRPDGNRELWSCKRLCFNSVVWG